MRKRIIAILLAMFTLLACAPAVMADGVQPGLDNFVTSAEYQPGQFKDVSEDKWYAANVAASFELGLVKGVATDRFNPEGSITLAEVITLAARIHSIYNTGTAVFQQGSPWYQVYIDYAIENGIIAPDDYADYNVPALRAQCALILSKTVPEAEFTAINTVTSLPDVFEGITDWGNAVFKLYRAGVLTGNDSKGTFTPRNNISRCEIATIITRIVVPELRKNLALTEQSDAPDMGLLYTNTKWTLENMQRFTQYMVDCGNYLMDRNYSLAAFEISCAWMKFNSAKLTLEFAIEHCGDDPRCAEMKEHLLSAYDGIVHAQSLVPYGTEFTEYNCEAYYLLISKNTTGSISEQLIAAGEALTRLLDTQNLYS